MAKVTTVRAWSCSHRHRCASCRDWDFCHICGASRPKTERRLAMECATANLKKETLAITPKGEDALEFFKED